MYRIFSHQIQRKKAESHPAAILDEYKHKSFLGLTLKVGQAVAEFEKTENNTNSHTVSRTGASWVKTRNPNH